MKTSLVWSLVLGGALLTSGCATKKFVRETAAPIQAKVDQVGEQTTQNTTAIESTKKDIQGVDERATAGISAARERAMTAEGRANEAMNKATEAGTLAADAKSASERNNRELGMLRNAVANIDDYKLQAETSVPFGFGKHALSKEAKEMLDRLVADRGATKRFVISVEGFTDPTGPAEYNADLSRRRARSVVDYLVGKHSIPVYRVHMIGLGEDKLVDEGRGREARAKNRRVEVKIFSADPKVETVASSGEAQ